MNSRLDVGVVGGSVESAVGRAHRTAMIMDGRFRILAGCYSKDFEITRETAKQWALPDAGLYECWETLLDKECKNLDALVVLTPPSMHKPVIIKALELGIPVISEKPLCVSSAEAVEIREALIRSGGYLAVIYNYTGYPMVRELRAQIASGKLGNLLHIRAEMPQEGFIRARADTGEVPVPQDWRLQDDGIPTVSLDLGVHLLQMIAFLTGGQPKRVIGSQKAYGAFAPLIDCVDAIIDYGDDISCNLWYGKSALGYRNGLRIRIFGSEGAAEWNQMDPERIRMTNRYGESVSFDRASDVLVAADHRYQRFKAGHPAGFIEALANYYEDIFEDIHARKVGTRNKSDYAAGVDVSLQGLRVLEAINQSNGLPVAISE